MLERLFASMAQLEARPIGTIARRFPRGLPAACLVVVSALAPAFAAEPVPPIPPEHVEVTATRIPEDADTVPASITIITGKDLRNRGARDLRGALALAVGIDISPGGDNGPASYVPELWGLREFDAYLLVVDGVPWGGAFNPAAATIDLSDVERIEVQRGAAPVMYGATSFVGVIHVIRNEPGSGENRAAASVGSYGSGGAGAQISLPAWGGLQSSLSAGVERHRFRDDRTEFGRGNLLWRGSVEVGGGRFRADVDGTWVDQDPASPHPREGTELSSAVPLDANHNMRGSHVNERHIALSTGFDRPFGNARWSTTLSVSKSSHAILRGFLANINETPPNAHGFRQAIEVSDVYLDTHLEFPKLEKGRLVVGVDHLYGRGRGRGGDFDYFVDLEGEHAPEGDTIPSAARVRISDQRNFTGLYAQYEWLPVERWRFEIGARLNRTDELRKTYFLEFGSAEGVQTDGDRRTVTRGSGAAGATWTAWRGAEDSALHVYANYRSTFKPAATDFGLDSETEILEPETAGSYEAGLKARLLDGRVDLGLSFFQMNFENLVVSKTVNGLPGLENAGHTRFRGIEAEGAWRVAKDFHWRTAYSLHDARFRDFVTEFDGVPTQLEGNRQEMTPRYMAATGMVYAPEHGLVGSVQVNWIGSRFLNKRNTALARAYATWSAGVGYRIKALEVRLDATNINNQRPPVSESELGDAQYYRLPSREVTLTAAFAF